MLLIHILFSVYLAYVNTIIQGGLQLHGILRTEWETWTRIMKN